MTDGVKKSALTREAILTLLSDAEVAKVSTAEDAPRLVEATTTSTSRTLAPACGKCTPTHT